MKDEENGSQGPDLSTKAEGGPQSEEELKRWLTSLEETEKWFRKNLEAINQGIEQLERLAELIERTKRNKKPRGHLLN